MGDPSVRGCCVKGIWERSVVSLQLCYESKTIPKPKRLLKKKTSLLIPHPGPFFASYFIETPQKNSHTHCLWFLSSHSFVSSRSSQVSPTPTPSTPPKLLGQSLQGFPCCWIQPPILLRPHLSWPLGRVADQPALLGPLLRRVWEMLLFLVSPLTSQVLPAPSPSLHFPPLSNL